MTTEVTFIVELLKAAPAVGALVVIVIIFVSYVRSRDDFDLKREEINRKFIKDLSDTCHTVQVEITKKTADSIVANTEATNRLRETIERKLL